MKRLGCGSAPWHPRAAARRSRRSSWIPVSRLGQAACLHIRRLCAGFRLGSLANVLVPVSMASAAWAGFPATTNQPGRTGTAKGRGNMKTLAAIALSGLMLIAVPAFGQTLIGEWQPMKTFCEDGKALEDFSGRNDRRIFDNASTTTINYKPDMDKVLNTKGCALHYKTNYSMISDNQYKVGPFLEMSSPICPIAAKHMNDIIKYTPSYIKNGNDKQFGTTQATRERVARVIAHLQKIKEGSMAPVSFKVSDDNQHLWIFYSENSHCRNARLVFQHKRIK